MGRSVNKVTMIGNLTRDIELKFTPSNQAVGSFGIALNREWKTPNGEKKEEVTFVDCEVWGKGAEIMAQYTRKGSRVYLEGRLKLDTWKDKTDGSNRSKLKVTVEDFTFLDAAGGEGQDDDGAYTKAAKAKAAAEVPGAVGDGDIPF